MGCDRYRDALSARIDGEDIGMPDAELDAHLTKCAGCRDWYASASALVRIAANRANPRVDITSAVLTEAAQRGLLSRDPDAHPARWRYALGTVAVLQLALAVASMVVGHGQPMSIHHVHELEAWDIALGVGFLFAAIRPARAWGMLPLVVALVACVAITSTIDLADGNASITHESAHALELVGLPLLWALARPGRLARTAVPKLRLA